MVLRGLILITLLLSFGSSSVFAQVNLVRNGDFETYSQCPSKADQIMLATGWTPLDTVTFNMYKQGNADCSADYCHECGTGVWNTVPNNQIGFQYPRSGKGMVGQAMYADYDTSSFNHYIRDYIVGRLIKPLNAGKRYCIAFFVVLSEYSGYGIKEIGAYLDNGSICAAQYCGVPQSQVTPQVVNNGGVITDTMRWTKIDGSFIANGTEKYIIIGNFKDRINTTKIKTSFPSSGTYYFIDDVSVVESTTAANAGPDTHVGAGDSVFIGRKDVAMDCYWTVLGSPTIIGTGAGIWVRPKTATSYIVTQTLCGVVTKDTVRVEAWAAGVHSINGHTQQFNIAPNPTNGSFEITQSVASNLPVAVGLRNVVGQQVYGSIIHFKHGKASIVTPGTLAPGLYYLTLKDGAGSIYNLRLVKE